MAIRYVRVRRSRAFWEPGKKVATALNLPASVALGEHGDEARLRAIELNAQLDMARIDKRTRSLVLRGSVTWCYQRFVETEAWHQMGLRTRDDYERCWPIIAERFGSVLLSKVTSDDSERFHVDIHPAHKPNRNRDPEGKLKLQWNTAHRTLKVWRALLNAWVEYKYIPAPAPIGRVSNPRPPGRDVLWLDHEVMTLVATAEKLGLLGMAIAIRVSWDAMLAPIDNFELPVGGYRGWMEEVRTARRKTQRKVYASITADTVSAVDSYLERLRGAGLSIADDMPLVRNAALQPYEGINARKYFERDFRKVREAAFPGDRRQMLDLRRSAITEGRLGGATLDDLGAAAANSLGNDQFLQSTYAHTASRSVRDARIVGRKLMTENSGKPK